ncbi:hypothetical protein [Drosophila suzukii associated hytrosavirus 1]|nr:hypothetical protein [Drosophila suzukii associated hytrosavirus 1]
MEYINNFGPISKLLYKSNVSALRYLGYYFDEHLTDNNLYSNTFMMVNVKDQIPDNTTCLMINVKISFERLNQIICESGIQSVIFFKDMFVENIDTNAVCKNIITVVCYNLISINMINRFFPNVRHIYLFRQRESINGKRINTTNTYKFDHLRELHVYSSGSIFNLAANNLEQLSIYSSFDTDWEIDLDRYPHLHTLRIDEKIRPLNLKSRAWNIIQFFPSKTEQKNEPIDLLDINVNDLLLPPTRQYNFRLGTKSSILGAYVKDVDFFTNILTIDIVGMQVYDNLYPLKMCSLRFSNQFYKYFPFPDEVNNELIERFNIQRQRENMIMIFNFDFMNTFDSDKDWQTWYNICIETYHRIPIIMQNAQLMLTNGTDDGKEKTWPNIVNKVRKECVIFMPEEELIYINCSPLRLQSLVDKIKRYRQQKFIISKLWLVTNGFEINTKDIEDRLDNIVIVHNEIKMYVTF